MVFAWCFAGFDIVDLMVVCIRLFWLAQLGLCYSMWLGFWCFGLDCGFGWLCDVDCFGVLLGYVVSYLWVWWFMYDVACLFGLVVFVLVVISLWFWVDGGAGCCLCVGTWFRSVWGGCLIIAFVVLTVCWLFVIA